MPPVQLEGVVEVVEAVLVDMVAPDLFVVVPRV